MTVASMRNLAASYAIANRQAEALALRDEALALERANLGMEDATTERSAAQLGENYAALNRHEQAIALGQEIFELLKTKLGPDDPATLRSMVRLASTYDKAGKRADAEQLCQAALERQKAKLGPDHHDTLESMYALSNLQSGEEQLQIRQEALALVEAKLGPGHADSLLWLLRVASSLTRLDRGAEVVALCDEFARRAGVEPPNIQHFQAMVFLRVKHFIKIGDPDGCRATAEMWEKLNRTDIYGCYNAAALRALTAAVIQKSDRSAQAVQRANAEADLAMNWLRKVAALGFQDFAHMEKNGDFESLRDREDFKKLVAELKARAQIIPGKTGRP